MTDDERHYRRTGCFAVAILSALLLAAAASGVGVTWLLVWLIASAAC